MAWSYTLDGYFTVRERGLYPWPCASQPERTFELFPGDVLTKHSDGSMTKHNGLCMTNLRVPDADLVGLAKPITMAVGGLRDL